MTVYFSRNVIKSAILLAADPFWAEIEFSWARSVSLLLHLEFILQMGYICDNEMHVRDVSCLPHETEMGAIEQWWPNTLNITSFLYVYVCVCERKR